jgi:hypothetical protein
MCVAIGVTWSVKLTWCLYYALCARSLFRSLAHSLSLLVRLALLGYVFADVAQAHSCVILYRGKPLGSALSDKVTTPRNKERQQWPISRSSHSLSLSASSALYWLPLIRGGEEGAANKCVMFYKSLAEGTSEINTNTIICIVIFTFCNLLITYAT